MIRTLFFIYFLIIFFLFGCTPSGNDENEKLKVVVTTGMIEDILLHLAGEEMEKYD
jgi:ABC-type Zn uptake system ZnuABC Zn-binding protein ZnuA